MAFKLLRLEGKEWSVWADLSDCWTYNGKPVRYRFCKVPESPPHITTWSIVLGPLSIKAGWLNNNEL